MKATDIKIERLKNPVGVDFQRPEISWVCDGGIRQSAYRVVASREGKIVWDSGRVESSDTHPTSPLASVSILPSPFGMKTAWRVR